MRLFWYQNKPLALRGHVTNASFKQWVGILLMPKIDRAHKNNLTPPKFERKLIFYGTLIFQQSSMICFGRHVGGHTTFCLYLVKRVIVTLRCAVNATPSSFQHFSWSLSAKFVFRKSKREWFKRANSPYMTLFPWKLFSIYSGCVSYCVVT